MTVQLTDEQYGAIWLTLSKIANGRGAAPHRPRLTRDDLMTLAREVCDQLGWHYDRKSVDGLKATTDSDVGA